LAIFITCATAFMVIVSPYSLRSSVSHTSYGVLGGFGFRLGLDWEGAGVMLFSIEFL
jgi:hypothetical protein